VNLTNIGFNFYFEEQFEKYRSQGYHVGRVALEHKHVYRVYTELGELLSEISGKMRHQSIAREDYPAVGDWVIISPRVEEEKATIHAVLTRKSKFSRKVAGTTTEEQIIATNIDTVFLVIALNHDFNVRRIERYLIMAWESGATPVIILSKADLCINIDERIKEVESVAIGVPIHVISSEQNVGLDKLAPYMKQGHTVALLGSSGVGKSTLINRMYGQEIQKVKEVREGDDRGRHTTTHRELILLPNGGILIDTPGMREFQLWESGDSFSNTFEDVETLAKHCFFVDCQHQKEPKCAILQALTEGSLEQSRWES
jgi:ribosome biogenesis GTPase